MMKQQYFFILGAPDPEMEAIENILRALDMPYGYAMAAGQRVHPFEAYKADTYEVVSVGEPGHALDRVFVECQVLDFPGIHIDHHRPGDPGFGRPPAEAWEASSIGQVFGLLDLDPAHWYVSVQDREWDPRVVAAADHCLTAAYQSEVPDVHPLDVREYRAHIGAAFRKMTVEEWHAQVDRATLAIRTAPVAPAPPMVYDLRPKYRAAGPVDLANEAAAQMGVAILYELPKGNRTQVGIIGASPEQVRWFKSEFAQAEGLVDVYGDPARGFAGGYKEADRA